MVTADTRLRVCVRVFDVCVLCESVGIHSD